MMSYEVSTSVKLRRPRDGGGIFRKLIVEVDNQQVARLKQGQDAAITIAPGIHVLQIKMDWTTSEQIQLVADVGSPQSEIEVSLPFSAILEMMTNPKNALRVRLLR